MLSAKAHIRPTIQSKTSVKGQRFMDSGMSNCWASTVSCKASVVQCQVPGCSLQNPGCQSMPRSSPSSSSSSILAGKVGLRCVQAWYPVSQVAGQQACQVDHRQRGYRNLCVLQSTGAEPSPRICSRLPAGCRGDAARPHLTHLIVFTQACMCNARACSAYAACQSRMQHSEVQHCREPHRSPQPNTAPSHVHLHMQQCEATISGAAVR